MSANNPNKQGPPENSNAPDDAGPPDDVQRRREQAQDRAQRRAREQQLGAKARSHLKRAREAEQQADPSKMGPEDRAIYHYLQAVTTVLEQDYDILLDARE